MNFSSRECRADGLSTAAVSIYAENVLSSTFLNPKASERGSCCEATNKRTEKPFKIYTRRMLSFAAIDLYFGSFRRDRFHLWLSYRKLRESKEKKVICKEKQKMVKRDQSSLIQI